jgi:hypothetical protein
MATKLKIEKGGMKLKKKSSPLKLLSQSQPNFAEMILGWSPSKCVSGISDHSQKSWVILLMNIHKPNRVIYDVSK